MVKPGEWVDDTFVQVTAFFLGLPIFLVPTGSATYTRLYHPISSDFESSTMPSPEPSSLWIGYINDQHYQSLLLNDEDQSVSRCPSPQGVDEALSRAFAQIQLELERGQVSCLLSGKYLKTPFKILICHFFRCRHQRQLPNQLTWPAPLWHKTGEVRYVQLFKFHSIGNFWRNMQLLQHLNLPSI